MMQSSMSSLLYKYAIAFIHVYSQELERETIASLFNIITLLKKNKQIMSHVPSLFVPLYALLMRHKRSHLLIAILDRIFLLWCQKNNVQMATIYSAHELENDIKERIQDCLSKKSNVPIVHIEYKIDQKLIAGIRIEAQDFVWEYSLKMQIEKIKKLVLEKGML